ncbi:MAG TPA: outer membrane lipid asymmetry maintenance protein MlaD [Hypericibacter adhaerens]|jgi:phospholipid/cholesterol/gamma-HCH transport system substrate-binding protein|uniref:outer membrane lipid asymmetry maintenance protein MlaD n=1 Tax=Hypericibacter adhaerens TaxID=2602016 RepID=UPI002B55EA7D|nr:outer membrane lipid asymmetry maintenance protein MlaD [Hypericibacter adhaerens]HWA45657.1 outer membrane lipid asymmetry maintenance protein MlaD [Hypericibacter adhaerens]
MKRNAIETMMGAVVLLVAATFLAFAYSSSNVSQVEGYELLAKFNRVDGISPGSEVRLSGIKVGSVLTTHLDPKTYLAEVRMSILNDVQLPTDSSARILSDGLLGNPYMALEPGADDTMIPPGGEIRKTQDPLNLVDLIGRFIFSSTGSGGSSSSSSGSQNQQ